MKKCFPNLPLDNRGQVLLIVVVTMIVALTAGLSIASRTITNLKLAKQNEESQRAFQAASSGIEKFLNSAAGSTGGGDLPSAKFETTVLTQTALTYVLNNSSEIDQDRGIDVWLSDYPNFANRYAGNITFYFGTKDQACNVTSGDKVMPALEITFLRGQTSNPILERRVYDPCASTRNNNFDTGSSASSLVIDGITFSRQTDPIGFGASGVNQGGLIARVIPLYNSALIGIKWENTPKSQGKLLESTGSSGETKRKIVYFESHPQFPVEVFPYSIISQ